MILAATAAVLLSGALAAVDASAAQRLRDCAPQDFSGTQVSRIRTNATCKDAVKVLRRLLAHGIAGLPGDARRASAWRCGKHGERWTCTRRRRGGRRERISFRAVASAPKRCIDLWNADEANASSLGLHFYLHHKVRRAWVFTFGAKSPERCAVIFAVPESDPEFGMDGEVSDPGGGWRLMNEVRELGDPVEIQYDAPANANASLDAQGKLAPLH